MANNIVLCTVTAANDRNVLKMIWTGTSMVRFNTLKTGLLNCLNARSRGLTFRHRASCM